MYIEDQFSDYKITRRGFYNFISGKNSTCQVFESGDVLGYYVLLFRQNSKKARLYSIAVYPSARRLRIGSHLLEHAEETARREGCTEIVLEVEEDNPAEFFYKKHGYRLFDKRFWYYKSGNNALRYKKTLV